MKRKNIIITIALGFALVPFYAGAEPVATSSVPAVPPTEAQVFTACSQAAIEVRDNSIGSARTTYNAAMAAALSARKEAEKEAVALTDSSEKKEAIREAVEEYKKAVTTAQEGLTKSRKEAWAAFEANTSKCREASKEMRKGAASERKASSTELRTMQADLKADIEASKQETRTIRESLFDQIRNLFRKGDTDNN